MNDARDFLAGKSKTELSAIARAAGTSLCHLRNICYGQKRAGPKLATRIELATVGALPRHRLRPDLWSPPPAAPDVDAAPHDRPRSVPAETP